MTSVTLTDAELAVLDGQCRDETQTHVDAAKARLASVDAHPDIPAPLAGFVADAVAEADAEGKLLYARRRARHCSLCGKAADYYRFKKGYRKGERDLDRPLTFQGIELADRFVRVQNHISLGGCVDCVTAAAPALAEALRGVNAEVPDPLRADGEPKRERFQNRRCTKCGWEGHEGEMGRLPTLFGDGTYPAYCARRPECRASNGLGRSEVESADGFTVVEVEAVTA